MSKENKEDITKKQVTRRSALKWTGGLIAAAGLGVIAGVGGDMILRPTVTQPVGPPTTITQTATPTTAPAQAEKWVLQACQGWGCHDHCYLKVYTGSDGKIDRVERFELPPPEGDALGMCMKGAMEGRLPYNTNRILYPMKRVGNRGEGKFQRITWDQAMSEIGQKVKTITDQYGPEALAFDNFACGYVVQMGAGMGLVTLFANTFGATVAGQPPIDTGPFFAQETDWSYPFLVGGPISTQLTSTYGYDPRLLDQTKYLIMWSCNTAATHPGVTTRHMMAAKERGVKLVDVGLWYDQQAAVSDWFIPVRGGTDTALALGMANVLVYEGLYDKQFMTNRTVAPFLVRNDNGMFLRESDITSGGDKNKYVWWDAVSKSAQTIAGHVFEFPEGTMPDLLAAQTVNGIACKTAFLLLKEHLADYTPQSQEKITNVPASTVIQLAHEYVQNRPATIWHNWGMRYQNAYTLGRSIILLSALSGNLGLPGGRLILGWCGPVGSYPINFGSIWGGPGKAKALTFRDYLTAATTGKPRPIKAIILVGGNTLHSLPSRQNYEALYGAVDLFVAYELRTTDTTDWADYLLPGAMALEKYDIPAISPSYNTIILNEPAIQPLGEAKDEADFFKALASALGVSGWSDNTMAQWCAAILDASQKFPSTTGITYDRLQQEKAIRANVPLEIYDPYTAPIPFDRLQGYNPYGLALPKGYTGENELDWPNDSGRTEFYFEPFTDPTVKMPMATYVEPYMVAHYSAQDQNKYPLQYVAARQRFFMQTQFQDDPMLRTLAVNEQHIMMNPKDAASRGISDGDVATAFNDRGSCTAKVQLTERMPPGLVATWYGFRKTQHIAGHHCYLNTPNGVPEVDTPASNKAWSIGHWANMSDNLWDARCEVQKGTISTS